MGGIVTPYYDEDGITIYHGDCRDMLTAVAFDVVVSDPPYGIQFVGGPKSCGANQYAPMVGDETTEMAEWVMSIQCRRVIFGAHEFPHLIAGPGRWFCWDKRLSESADRMIGSPFELAWDNATGPNIMLRCMHGGVINANGASGRATGLPRLHPTEKAIPMLRALMAHLPAGTILDPFMGSGTTLRAAKDLGRRAIGVEIDERYCEIAAKRLGQGVLDFGAAV